MTAPLGCGGAVSAPAAPATAKAAAPAKMVTPARLIPEVDGSHLEPWFSEQGRDKHLLAGLRIVVHDGGRVEPICLVTCAALGLLGGLRGSGGRDVSDPERQRLAETCQ
jgi:hypothetical protein